MIFFDIEVNLCMYMFYSFFVGDKYVRVIINLIIYFKIYYRDEFFIGYVFRYVRYVNI